MNTKKSELFYERSCKILPGGVNSPVRAFGSVGTNPIFISQASGSRIYDEDYNEYIDYIGSWGPSILGHANPIVTEAVKKRVCDGFSFGLPTKEEAELGELIKGAMPSIEMLRMTSSGTEAVMAAIRLSRAFTKRSKIVKFEGCYHGHSDAMLVKSGSGLLTNNIINSNGLTKDILDNTITLPFNNIEAIIDCISKNGNEIAALIIEPIAANMGLIIPHQEYLKKIRELTTEYGIILIFDEVITGFRIGLGGAQEYYKVLPDLTILGKIIGGGLPAGAFGGKKEIMSLIAPLGNVYHAGTNSGNPIAVTAGIETIKILMNDKNIYSSLETKSKTLCNRTKFAKAFSNIDFTINHTHSLFTLFFANKDVVDLNVALSSDTEEYGKFFRFMLSKGIMMPPSQFEACFISSAHSISDINYTASAFEEYFTSRHKE